MILGMSTATFTFLHVVISLMGIASGFVVVSPFCSSSEFLLCSRPCASIPNGFVPLDSREGC
jgi:hypothetical protein